MSPAPRAGKRYPLLLYRRMLDRWWPALLLIGLGMLALAWPFYSDVYTQLTQPWRWMTPATVGIMVIGASVLMLLLRNSAYIQPLGDHFRLVTPFLRLNVSYRRVRRVSTAVMSALFPPRSLHGLKRDILQPYFGQTAVVIDLNAMPIPLSTLKLFLSPFFFKDQTAHIVILVRDWLGFSTELESLRSGTTAPELVRKRSPSSVLSQLPQKK